MVTTIISHNNGRNLAATGIPHPARAWTYAVGIEPPVLTLTATQF